MTQQTKNSIQTAGSRERKKRLVVNRQVSLRMSLIFLAFLLLLGILMLVLPRPSVSEIERRSLASWPEFTLERYFAGEYTGGITQFYDDTVPFRDSLKNAGNNLKSLFGLRTAGSVNFVGNARRIEEEPVQPEEQTVPVDETPTEAAEEETTPGPKVPDRDYRAENADANLEDGILIVYQDGHWRSLVLYGGVFDTMYSDTVNYVRQVLDADVNIYFMPIPLAAQFYLPANYADYSADHRAVFREASSCMDSAVRCIDIIDVMNAHNEENIYLRTDHHWSPLGAYYAAQAFAAEAGVPFASLDDYTQYVNEGYIGTMYAYTEDANLLNDPEDFVYYVPTNSYTADYYDREFNYTFTYGLFYDTSVGDSYSTFMGGDDKIVKVTTDTKNGRRVLVIKDSYGNAMIPYLTRSFEEIYVIDQRYFEVNLVNFILYNAITDVLFTHNYMSLAGPETELLEYITYSNADVPVYDDAPEAVLPER